MGDPEDYMQGEDRYVNFAHDFLEKRTAEFQRQILRAVTKNQRILLVGANGPGKSYTVAMLKAAFLYTNADSVVLGTSGSYNQYVDTMWRPLEGMVKEMKKKHDMPGRLVGGQQPRLEIDPEWFAKVVSPRDPGELEGRHGPDVLVVIEEADKKYITDEHFDSAGSSITDMNDKMVVIANPPEDESNIVYRKMNSERWHVIRFSSFDAHNVLVDMNLIDEEPIPGIVDLPTVAEDWEAWNNEPWPDKPSDAHSVTKMKDMVENDEMSRDALVEMLRPGFDTARVAHETRDTLDTRWYRRRAGVIPPSDSTAFKPFSVSTVEDQFVPRIGSLEGDPDGAGLDVARMGGDKNAMTEIHGLDMEVHEIWSGVDHGTNEARVREHMDGWSPNVKFAVDAQAEGSGLADRLADAHPGVIRFNSGERAVQEKQFYNRWTEGLYALGQWLRNGGTYSDKRLREELLAAARTISLEERHYASRDSTVLKADKKDKIKEHLGRSPDVLDSAMQAAWAASDEVHTKEPPRLVW